MNQLRHLTQALSIIGMVKAIHPQDNRFEVETRGGTFTVQVQPETYTEALRNLDDLGRGRKRLDQADAATGDWRFADQIFIGELIAVRGVWHHHEGNERFDAVSIHLPYSSRGMPHFEHSHWWVHQLVVMANKWLDDLFGDRRSYEVDDFAALYRTNLNILGLPTDDDTQEMATLSRLIYGLSSAFLITGDDRYVRAARAGVHFQQQAFRSYSTDGRFCFWYHAIKRERYRNRRELESSVADDAGSIPLYEQIYALAGLALYYRITGDWQVLLDIRRTVAAMLGIWGDWKQNETGEDYLDGFWSHIDPVTFRPDDASLAANRAGRNNRQTKNWNSIGDHIPAYLMNLMLALDPLPTAGRGEMAQADLKGFAADCELILTTTARLIRDRFPQDDNPFVQERFRRSEVDGTDQPDQDWGWQQDRAVVGHNLKIAWNLTRVGNWLKAQGRHEAGEPENLFELAKRLGRSMGELGVDQVRGGVYDVLERDLSTRQPPLQFGWFNSKDFWQQEQGILAYLILYGCRAGDGPTGEADFLQQARELSLFWNLYFLDRERSGVFFRVNDNGQPIVEGEYGNIGGHSKSGYHVFELAFLAHVYQMAYVPRRQRQHSTFALHFRPAADSGLQAINCLPDAVAPGVFEIQDVLIDGVPRPVINPLDL
ncbi:MAG TPA: hypothetical protein VES73_04110, partial [Lamprocystis sp. (in: g-proteobacteria)]|nr:hypothetical protein [Lamprocystis sp. (in: g-proteobacteria)]